MGWDSLEVFAVGLAVFITLAHIAFYGFLLYLAWLLVKWLTGG